MTRATLLSTVMAFLLAACGGGEPAGEPSTEGASEPAASSEPAAATGPMTMPDWFHADEAAQTVHLTITAGATDKQNYWNFNGATNGEMTITVPEGYTVTVDLVNSDPMMAHSLGLSTQTSGFGASLDPNPVFEGAITPNPTSMVEGTMPGENATIEFVADAAGNYSMVCYIPGHAAVGMWVRFNVSADGQMGVQGAPM